MADVMDLASPPPNAEDPLDAEIQRARNDLEIACTRRDALTSALLCAELVQNLTDDRVASPFVAREPLADVLSRHQTKTTLQDRRSLLTTTLFSTRDPDPCAKNGGNVHSVRIERYSRLHSRFLTPAYVFLQKSERRDGIEGEAWRVHRHTLPPCIPIRALSAKYLPDPVSGDDGTTKHISKTHDIQGFVRVVTQETVSLLRREEAIEAIKSPEIKSAIAVNAEATDVRLSWKNGAVTRIRVSSAGVIERVVAEKGHVRNEGLERKVLAAQRLDALQDIF